MRQLPSWHSRHEQQQRKARSYCRCEDRLWDDSGDSACWCCFWRDSTPSLPLLLAQEQTFRSLLSDIPRDGKLISSILCTSKSGTSEQTCSTSQHIYTVLATKVRSLRVLLLHRKAFKSSARSSPDSSYLSQYFASSVHLVYLLRLPCHFTAST